MRDRALDNLRGSLLMTAAMACFALEDTLIKLMSDALPMGQVVAMLGVGGTAAFALLIRARGQRLWSPAFLSPPLLLRNVGEVIATSGFVAAIVLTDLSSASAILQATPLAVTLGAAVFLGEYVGWRRWMAIALGFAGVLLIIRPGLEGFEPASLFAVMGVAGLALRDIAVRRVPLAVTSAQVSAWGLFAFIPAGLLMMAVMATPPELPGSVDSLRLTVAVAIGVCGYYAIVAATRTGEVAVVVPFRYSRLLFALLLGVLVFGERPDGAMLIGAALIVAAGLYTLWREARPAPVAVAQ